MVPSFSLQSILAGNPLSQKETVKGHYWGTYCGWTNFCTTLKPIWEPIVRWHLQGNHHSRAFLGGAVGTPRLQASGAGAGSAPATCHPDFSGSNMTSCRRQTPTPRHLGMARFGESSASICSSPLEKIVQVVMDSL